MHFFTARLPNVRPCGRRSEMKPNGPSVEGQYTRPAVHPYPSGVVAGRARGGSHTVPSRKDRVMRTTLALGFAVAFGALAAAEDKKFDAAKLEGNWEYKSGEKNGQKLE